MPNATSFPDDKFKKTGNAGIKGVKFQIRLITLCFLKAFDKFKGWRLSSENQKAGKFDDVVLEGDEGAILIQTKYRQNGKITFDELLSTNSKQDDFSLIKYYRSYQEIKSQFQVTNVVICTNATIKVDTERKKFFNEQNASPDSILHCEDRRCLYYTFEDTIIPLLKEYLEKSKCGDDKEITDQDVRDFLKHLQFYYDYPCESELKNIMEQLLSRMRLSNQVFNKVSLQDILNKVNDWFEQPKGNCEYLTRSRANAMFSEISSDKFCEKLNQYNVLFKDNDLEFEDTKRIFHITVENEYLLSVIKTFQALRSNRKKVLTIKPDDNADIQKQMLETFDLPRYEFLIIIWPKLYPKNLLTEIYTKLRNTLERYKYKKVILVAKNDDILISELGIDNSLYQTVNLSVKFVDFLKDTQANLLKKKKIVFQENKYSLEEVYGNEINNFDDLNPNVLERIVKGEEIIINPRIHFENNVDVDREDVVEATSGNVQMLKFVDRQNSNSDGGVSPVLYPVEQKVDLLYERRDMIEFPLERDGYFNGVTVEDEAYRQAVIPTSGETGDFGIVRWFLERGTLVNIGNEFGNKTYYTYITSRSR